MNSTLTLTNKPIRSEMERYARLCQQIPKYRDGDIMSLLDWGGEFADLAKSWPAGTPARSLCLVMSDLMDRALRGERPDFLELAARGLDLLGIHYDLPDFEPTRAWLDDRAELERRISSPVLPAVVSDASSGASAAKPSLGLRQRAQELARTAGAKSARPAEPAGQGPALGAPGASAAAPQFPVQETLPIFFSEARERMARAQECLLDWEQNLDCPTHLEELFRIFHTIKGECGFLGLPTIGQLTHDIENVLDALRHGHLLIDQALIDVLLESCDWVNVLLEHAEFHTQPPSTEALGQFCAKMEALAFPDRAPSEGTPLIHHGHPGELHGQFVVEHPSQIHSAQSGSGKGCPDPGDEQIFQVAAAPSAGSKALAKHPRHDPLVRVKAGKINTLVDTIGELLILIGDMPEDEGKGRQIRKITRELQTSAMSLRTDSLKTLFGNLNRVVRDLARQTGKSVSFATFGQDMEMDRNLMERIEEPLLHMVRNSVDHGIECPADRLAKGKPETGKILVGAERRGNHVEISIYDDGRGLSREHILTKAQAKGLVRSDQASSLSDNDVYALIFAPGFSTVDKVTQISGRGVGMDIVRQTVQAARGRVAIETETGHYLKIRLTFPLSAAIVEGIVTRLGTESFVVPVASIVESFSLDKKDRYALADTLEMMEFRGQAIPLIHLRSVLGTPARPDDPLSESCGIVVEDVDQRRYILVADEIVSKAELVLKPLGPYFRKLKGVSGATVLQGGQLALLLDVDQIIALSVDSQGAFQKNKGEA